MKTNKFSQIKLFTIAIILLLTVSCGGGGGGGNAASTDDSADVGPIGFLAYTPDTSECTETAQREFIYTAMHDVYLWSSNTPSLSPTSYSSNTELLNALKYSADKWSYVISQADYNAYYSGDNIGMGFKYAYSALNNEIFLTFVYPGSPADNASLERGYELTNINGYSATDIIQNSSWDDAFGPNELGYNVGLTYIDNNNNTGTVSLTKDTYTADSVPAYDIFTNNSNGEKIGYLLYLHFNSNYTSDLSAAFTAFRDNGVKELVIDLRYNGGGQTSAARYIASAVAGSSLAYEILYYYIHNTRYSSWNRAVALTAPSYDLAVDKVVFLVSDKTASSSELLITGLQPYISTYLIGSDTYGKPAGMYSFPFCSNYLVPISFQTYNSAGYGEYYSGVPVDCDDTDDLEHQLGDPNERMLQNAINYLENGTCLSRSRTKTNDLKAEEREGIYRVFNFR